MKTIMLGGREIRVREKLMAGPVLKFAEEMRKAGELEQVAAIGSFLRSLVMPEDLELYSAALEETELVDLTTVVAEVMRQHADRPTERPSASPGGSRSTGGTPKVVSLWPATARAAPTSSPAGQSRVS